MVTVNTVAEIPFMATMVTVNTVAGILYTAMTGSARTVPEIPFMAVIATLMELMVTLMGDMLSEIKCSDLYRA